MDLESTTAYAYITNTTLHIQIKPKSFLPSFTVKGPLGQLLMNFIWIESEQENLIFQIVDSLFASLKDTDVSQEQLKTKFFNVLMPLAQKSPYLFLYADLYLAHLLQTNITFNSITPADSLRENLLKTIILRRSELDSDLELILGESQKFSDYTPLQKLYLLSSDDALSVNYLETGFHSSLKPVDMFDDISYSDLLSVIKKNRPDIVEMYELKTITDMFRFELTHMLSRNILFKRCKCCGKFFIPTGRSDSEYCNRIVPNSKKRCKEIGAAKTFKNKHQDDTIHKIYRTAYARMDSRKRYKSITQKEFNSWSFAARQMRDDCKNGKISLENFQKWLDESKKNKF